AGLERECPGIALEGCLGPSHSATVARDNALARRVRQRQDIASASHVRSKRSDHRNKGVRTDTEGGEIPRAARLEALVVDQRRPVKSIVSTVGICPISLNAARGALFALLFCSNHLPDPATIRSLTCLV